MVTRRRLVFVLSALVLCAWCGWVSGFHRATTPARVTWGFSLAAVVVVDLLLWQGRRGAKPGWRLEPVHVGWPRPGRGGARRALAGAAPWLALLLVVLAWDVLGLDTGKHEAHLTISAITQAYRPMNAAMLLVWTLVGIGYGAARARAPVGATCGDHGSMTATGCGACVVLAHLPAATPALLLPSSRLAGVAFWLGVVVVAATIDQIARRSGGRLANAEELLRFVTRPAAANAVLVVAWAYAGYHIFAH
jgi:hypothetical protein